MALGNDLGLVFKIIAQDNASAAIKAVEKNIDSASNTIKSKGTAAFDELTKGLGLSEEKASALSAALPGLGTAITTITSAAVGGGAALFALAKSTADYGSQIHDIAEATNFSTETISALKLAADQSGTSIEAVSSGLGKFSKLLGQANDGNKQATATLKEYGLTAKTALADPEAALAKVVARIHELKGSQDQVILTQRTFGKGSQDLIPVVNTLNGNLADYIENGKKLGLVLSQTDADAADAFGDSLGELQQAVRGVSQVFAREFLPDITRAMGTLENLLLDNKRQFKEWGEYVSDIIRGISTPDGANLPEPPEKEKLPTLFGLPSDEDLLNFVIQNSSNTNLARTLSGENAATRGAKLRQLDNQQTQGILEGTIRDPNYGQAPDATSNNKTAPGISPLPERLKKEKFELSDNGKALVKAAAELGIDPLDLATIISYETGGTYSPSIKGGKGGNYRGLIQFGKEEYSKYNVGKNQTFDSQLENSVVPFFKDRFAKVGKSTFGANILDLYKTVNGGSPDVSENASDGNGTIAQHVARMIGKNRQGALNKFFGGDEKNVHKGRTEFDEIGEQLKINEKIVSDREKMDNRILELDRTNGDKRKAELDKQLAEKRISEEDYADKIAQIGIDALEKEKQLLTERLKLTQLSAEQRADVQQRISVLASEIETKSIEKTTDKIKDQNKELERQYQINLEIAELRKQVLDSEQQTVDFQKDQERIKLQNAVDDSYGKDRLSALVVLEEFEIGEADRKHEQNLDNISAEEKREIDSIEKRVKDDVKFTEAGEKEKALIHAKYANVRTQENDQNDAAHKGIDAQYNPQILDQQTKTGGGIAGRAADILGGISGGVSSTDAAGKVKTQADLMKGVTDDLAKSSNAAIGSMVGGLANLAQQWILTGKFSVRAAAQMVAGILASLAIEDAVKALHEYAEGLALAANPLTAYLAPGHFAAAAAYGVAAAEAGAAGVAIGLLSRAGGGGSASSSFAGASSPTASTNSISGSSNDTRTITESRRQSQAEDRTETLHLIMRIPKDAVDKGIIDAINNRTDGHAALVTLIQDTA